VEERKHGRGKDGVKEEQTKCKESYLFSKGKEKEGVGK